MAPVVKRTRGGARGEAHRLGAVQEQVDAKGEIAVACLLSHLDRLRTRRRTGKSEGAVLLGAREQYTDERPRECGELAEARVELQRPESERELSQQLRLFVAHELEDVLGARAHELVHGLEHLCQRARGERGGHIQGASRRVIAHVLAIGTAGCRADSGCSMAQHHPRA